MEVNEKKQETQVDDVELLVLGGISGKGIADENVPVNFVEKREGPTFFLSRPGFHLLMTYEGVIFVLILWEMFEIPFRFAFTLVYPLGFLVFAAIIDLIFIFDTGLRFFWPLLNDRGQYITGPPQKIVQQYVTSWFIPDAISAIPWDFMYLCIVLANPTLALSLYWMPYCRITRGLRLFQIFRRLREWEVVVNWSFDPVVLRATAIVIASLLWISLTGCLFWMIAILEGHSWAWMYQNDPNNIVTKSPFFQYLTGIYWSIVTFSTCGFGDLAATTLATRIYVFFYCVISVGILAYATGNIVTWLQSSNAARTILADQLAQVKNYIEYRQYSKDLSRRLLTFHRFKGLNDSFPHNDKHVIDMLSPAMRLTLGAHFRRTIFKNWCLPQICDDFFVTAIIARMKRETRYPGEYIAWQRSLAHKFYILTSGQVEVSVDGMVVFEMSASGGSEPGPIFGEYVLFKEECYRNATLRAMDFCDLVYLKRRDVTALLDLFSQYKPRVNAYSTSLKSQYDDQNAQMLRNIRGETVVTEKAPLEKIPNQIFATEILNDPFAVAKVMAMAEGGVSRHGSEDEFFVTGRDCVDWLVKMYKLKRIDAIYLGKRLQRGKHIFALKDGGDFDDDDEMRFRFSRSVLGLGSPAVGSCFALDIVGATPSKDLGRLVKENPDFQLTPDEAGVDVPKNFAEQKVVVDVEALGDVDVDSSSDDEEDAGLFRRGTVLRETKKQKFKKK
jgi:hypothetical protein